MAVNLYNTATEYIAVPITLGRGKVADITSVGMYVNTNPATVPAVGAFTTVILVDGTATPPLPDLAVAGEIDILALVGPGAGSNFPALSPASSYQIWVLITTANEEIIRKCDMLTIT